MRKKSLGPKPKPPAEKQSEKILLSVTPAEYALLKRAAGKQPLATFIREISLRSARRRVPIA